MTTYRTRRLNHTSPDAVSVAVLLDVLSSMRLGDIGLGAKGKRDRGRFRPQPPEADGFNALLGGWNIPDLRSAPDRAATLAPPWSDDPTIIGATGGSGTRVLAEMLRGAGVFIGADLNRALDALPMTVLFDVWINVYAARGTVFDPDDVRCLETPMARSLTSTLAQHWGGSEVTKRPWGWKNGRSMFLLPFFHQQLPRLRFVHLVRDGRDIAFSSNQRQLDRHGPTYLSREERRQARPVKSMILWSRVNLATARYGERELGERYLRIRFEDLCADPPSTVGRLLDFLELNADASELARLVHPPSSIGRWQSQDPRLVRKLHRMGRKALHMFGYVGGSPLRGSRAAATTIETSEERPVQTTANAMGRVFKDRPAASHSD